VRDSSLKRVLVAGYFNAREVTSAFAGMVREPAMGAPIDYDAYWRHRGTSSVQPRFDIIVNAIGTGESILDVGCGDGAMLAHFAGLGRRRGVGIDVSHEAVRRAAARGVDARVDTMGGLLAGGERFDHVVLSEVVEHVADAEGLVRDAWQLAQKTLWLTFPNIAYFPHRLRLAAGRFPVQWVVFPGEHLRFWSVPDFRRWMAGLGLPAPRMIASNGFTVARLHRVWPNLFGNQIVARIDRASS